MKSQNSQKPNKFSLVDSKGKKISEIELDKDVFAGSVNEALLYQAILMYRARQRAGTASTKTRSQVAGSGKKPWRQKGTGRARFGSIRNPVWRGGGIAFGPHPRDFRYSVPRKIKKGAFIASLNAKLKGGKVLAVEDGFLDEAKTRKFARLLRALNIEDEKVLFLVSDIDRNMHLASRNIKKLTLKKINEATALDVLSNERVVVAKAATEFLRTAQKR